MKLRNRQTVIKALDVKEVSFCSSDVRFVLLNVYNEVKNAEWVSLFDRCTTQKVELFDSLSKLIVPAKITRFEV